MAVKKRTARGNVVWRQTAEEATLANKPRYNGYACGHGAHGPTKYDRAKTKRQWKSQLHDEGASRGSFLFLVECYGLLNSRLPLIVGEGRVS